MTQAAGNLKLEDDKASPTAETDEGPCPQMGNGCPGELEKEVERGRMDFGKHLQCAQASYGALYL